ncbi:hypothetical protein [uncultured Tateyamaria sp.]|uniref:hypothetical protein n=1 Tax=uncultured Tateyamaria sp. TaxID=455651 RepID=UPI0026218897|nr:hypothetical protein [uncultured Tateyamaria sp.]
MKPLSALINLPGDTGFSDALNGTTQHDILFLSSTISQRATPLCWVTGWVQASL